MSFFQKLKDTRRRVVETVLQKTGMAEETTDPALDELFRKFVEMVDDMNECGAALSSTLVNQVLTYRRSLRYRNRFFNILYLPIFFDRKRCLVIRTNCQSRLRIPTRSIYRTKIGGIYHQIYNR